METVRLKAFLTCSTHPYTIGFLNFHLYFLGWSSKPIIGTVYFYSMIVKTFISDSIYGSRLVCGFEWELSYFKKTFPSNRKWMGSNGTLQGEHVSTGPQKIHSIPKDMMVWDSGSSRETNIIVSSWLGLVA